MLTKHGIKDVISVLISGPDICVQRRVWRFEEVKPARQNVLVKKPKMQMKRLCRKEERSAKTEHFGFVSCCIFGFSTMPRQVQNIFCPALRSNCQVDLPCVGGIWCIMDWCDGLRSGSNTKPSWGPVSAIVAVLHSNFWLQWVLVAYRLDFSIETWNICFSNKRLLWVALVHYFHFLGHTKGGNHWQRRWLLFKRAYQFHMHTVSGVFGGKTLTHPKLLVRGLVKV